jgi:hypothetical protein
LGHEEIKKLLLESFVGFISVGAQIIAHGYIGDSISQKTKIFGKLFLQKIKNGKFSSRFWKNYRMNFKSRK